MNQYLEKFFRSERIKWNFRNYPLRDFREVSVFSGNFSQKPPLTHCNSEVLLSQVESELFKETQDSLRYDNMSQEK